MRLSWKQNDRRIAVGDKEIVFPLRIYKICELDGVGFCVVLMAEQGMSDSLSTALVYSWNGELLKEMLIEEEGRPIRFGSCSVENGQLCLFGENDHRYCFDLTSWQLVKKSYYR